MRFSGDATVTIDLDAVEQMTGMSVSEAQLREQLSSGDMTVDGKEYVVNQISLEGRNMVIDAQNHSAEQPDICLPQRAGALYRFPGQHDLRREGMQGIP